MTLIFLFFFLVQIDETSNSDLVGMEFLMMVMELREAIDSSPPEKMEELMQEIQNNIQQVLDELEIAFDGNQEESKTDLERARKLAAQLQYWHRIESTIRDKLDSTI